MEPLNVLNRVEMLDVSSFSPDDEEGWAQVARAILAADLVVTL